MAKKRERGRYIFWKKVHFKYKMSILNENTLEEVWKLRVSVFNGVVLFLVFFFVIIILTSVVIIKTPIRNYLPGYLDAEIRDKAIYAAIKIDSLEQQQSFQIAQIENIKDIFAGKVQSDDKISVDTISISDKDESLQASSKELDFRENYEKEEVYNLSSALAQDNAPTEGITFFPPGNGTIIKKFDTAKDIYAIELRLSKQTVLATLEGTVVFTGYDSASNYIIQLQHKNGFLSIYKNASLLLKKTGEKVRTGEAIAIINDNRDKLIFELWYKGNPVNPELYITF